MEINRAKLIWESWEEKAAKIQELTGTASDKQTMLLKYRELTFGLQRILLKPLTSEKLYIHAIKVTTENLLKQLYPNPVRRLFYRLQEALIERPVRNFLLKDREGAAMGRLSTELKNVGLQYFSNKLESEMDFIRENIELRSVSNLMANQKLEVVVHLKKTRQFEYEFKGYTATLIDENGQQKSTYFPSHENIKLNEALNLLQGRPVYKASRQNDGSVTGQWCQIERSMQMQDGKYELLSYSNAYDYDLKSLLQDIAIKSECYGMMQNAVLKGLQAGNVVALEISGKGKVFLSANPSEKTVNITDSQSRLISMAALAKLSKSITKSKSLIITEQN